MVSLSDDPRNMPASLFGADLNHCDKKQPWVDALAIEAEPSLCRGVHPVSRAKE